ncbi:phosphoribosylformylglycinamidine synthase I [Candidatus Micrarchaeota archaeon]|nr:phosphoribosylformylglycinamidine synthase I [Candidatus Micrarchaeota archaeon]
MSLRSLILTGYGINCEVESKYAIEKSGGAADIVHLNKLLGEPKMLREYNMLMIPGGFSFGDDLGSGKVFGNKMKFKIHDELLEFVKGPNLVLGICNGFQIVVKMGLLPEPDFVQRATLTNNDSGHYEDRWVILKGNEKSPCVFTKGIDYLIVPVRHGEGKFVPKEAGVLKGLKENNQIVFQYVDEKSNTSALYPHNPNGSVENIAGICDKSGRIFGMMPHPEAFNMPQNCPHWVKGTVKEALGLRIFKNAVEFMR